MQLIPTAIPDVLLFEPKVFGDARGFFSEVWSRRALAEAGLDTEFVQDNHSLSTEAGVVRGLHFQKTPSAQGKLVRVVRGAILDVAVDIRAGSPTYGYSPPRAYSVVREWGGTPDRIPSPPKGGTYSGREVALDPNTLGAAQPQDPPTEDEVDEEEPRRKVAKPAAKARK